MGRHRKQDNLGKHGVETKVLLPSKSQVIRLFIYIFVVLFFASLPVGFGYYKAYKSKMSKINKPVKWSEFKRTSNIANNQKINFPIATRLMGFENAVEEFTLSNTGTDAASEVTGSASQDTPSGTVNANSLANKVILIDPGHGDEGNTGATGPTGLREIDLVMAVATELKKLFEKDGASVRLTRESNISELNNRQRGELANELGADTFIRIHADKWPESQRGFQVLWFKDNSKGLAKTVDEAMKSSGFSSRGVQKVYSEGFDAAEVPSVLLDMGNLSNKIDEILLKNKDSQLKIAAALHMAVKRYLLSQE